MSEIQQDLGGDEQSARDSAPVSFHERAMNRLDTESRPHRDDANFDDRTSNLNQAIPQDDQVDQRDAHQPDVEPQADSLDPDLDQGYEQAQEDIDEGVDNSNVEDVAEDAEVASIRQRADDAEAKLQSFQTDYTQKTQKLGAQRRELVADAKKNKQISEMYAARAGQNLARYETVNWQQLQSTLDPKIYSQRVAEYRQAVGIRDRATHEHQQIVDHVDQLVEVQKQHQAEDSKEILSKTIDNWGNELYGELRNFAVENLDFSQEEFDSFADHRIISLIHGRWQMSNTGKRVESIQQHGRQPRPGGPNKGRPLPGGNSRKIRDRHERNPGDRQASRNFFEDKLRRERGR